MESKTCVVIGASTNLGTLVAQKYGSNGYDIVLVDSSADLLARPLARLGQDGIRVRTLVACPTDPEFASKMLGDARAATRSIDAIYYGPSQGHTEVALDGLQARDNLLFLNLVAVVNEVLPEMRNKGGGIILADHSVDPVSGQPVLRGSHAALAAARDYLGTLQGRLLGEGIYVSALNAGSLSSRDAFIPAV